MRAHLCHVSQGAQPLQPSTHTHTHAYIHPAEMKEEGKQGRQRRRGGRLRIGGGDRPTVCQLVSCPRVVTHTLPSVSPSAHIHTHSHTNSSCSSPGPCTLTHTHTQHAGVTVRRMTGGSSRCNSPSWPNTDSSRHLRQLPLSRWGRANLKTGVKKKKKRKNQQLQN